ncbi:hypothetical protein C4D60_Mb01t00260 [Musa balbisiana]|uniref:Uncharacterized protein n=1 Tax=Musa balbisiana TaxID=52838 RepID=A0A4S8JKR8_MUSBA|nr:hypothetical protein C4D60_Mb01t00260 [Musa balbisiana]
MHHRSTCISCQEGCWRASLASASRLNTPSSLSLSLSHGTTVIAPHIAIPQPSPRISRQQSGRDNRLSNNLEATEAAAIRGKRGVTSPETERERGVEAGGSASMDGAQKAAAAWPKLALSLTNKEKEEDFLVFKGSKLPQRPKKRAKLLQRTINFLTLNSFAHFLKKLVSPGAWLCDLTLDRYEVREKKISKKEVEQVTYASNQTAWKP